MVISPISALFWGGAAKLARFCRPYNKQVYAIDIFDPGFDTVIHSTGIPQSTYYKNIIASFGKTQRGVYDDSVKGLDNVVTIAEDSKLVTLAPEEKIVFAVVDGNHTREYVMNDFYLVWPHLVPGGAVAFDDYRNPAVPQVTAAVDDLIRKHRQEIAEIVNIVRKRVIILVKTQASQV